MESWRIRRLGGLIRGLVGRPEVGRAARDSRGERGRGGGVWQWRTRKDVREKNAHSRSASRTTLPSLGERGYQTGSEYRGFKMCVCMREAAAAQLEGVRM